MYNIIRFVFWGIVLCGCIVCINKLDFRYKKRLTIISVILITALWTVSSIFPVENAFTTFSSPTKAFSYVHNEDVVLVVPGASSDMIFGQKDDATFIRFVAPKTEKGWKLPGVTDMKNVQKKVFNGGTVTVEQYKNTNDYYVTVRYIGIGSYTVTDNHNSTFFSLEAKHENFDISVIQYITCISIFDKSYTITVNGEKITF